MLTGILTYTIGTLAELFPIGNPIGAVPIFYSLTGKADLSALPRFATYGDHRMAMAFAALAMLGPVEIEDPEVVSKSYPQFWEHLGGVGFVVQ